MRTRARSYGPRISATPVSRRYPSERLLALADELFSEHGPNLTLRQFARDAGVSMGTVVNHVGNWLDFKKRFGHPPIPAPRARIQPRHSREALITTLQRLARDRGDAITLRYFERESGVSATVVYSRFKSWSELRIRAGLSPHNRSRARFSNEALLADMCRVYIHTKQPLTRQSYMRHGIVCLTTIRNRFGSWPAALDAYLDFIDKLVLEFPRKRDRQHHLITLTASLRR